MTALEASPDLYGRLLEGARVDNERDGSRWYLDPDDPAIRYQSVTWICGASESAPWLVDWAGKITAEWVVDNLDLVLSFFYGEGYGPGAAGEAIKGEGRRQRDLAAEVGTWLHDVLEALILDGPIPDPPPDMLGRRLDGEVITQALLDSWAQGLLHFLEDYRPVPTMAEATVCNPVEGYAGTLDLGALLPGLGVWMIDLKSGKHLPQWLELQLTGYWNATEVWLPLGGREPLPVFDRVGVLHLRPHYGRGYKLREIDPTPSVWGEFQRRLSSLQWREQKRARPVVYPPGPDGGQPPPLVEDLPLRTRRALVTAGLVTLTDVAGFTAKELTKVDGFGKTSVAQLRGILAGHGLTLRGEEFEEAAS